MNKRSALGSSKTASKDIRKDAFYSANEIMDEAIYLYELAIESTIVKQQ